MKSKKNTKKLIIIVSVVVIFIVLVVLGGFLLISHNKNPYGDRCSDRNNYEISDETIKKVEKKFKEIKEVDKVEVYTKLCTVKIIVNLKTDVDISAIKTKAKESLAVFSEKELGYYDFALYVTSDNEESDVYPINVNKHNSREDFAW